jgi:hypothetical protein
LRVHLVHSDHVFQTREKFVGQDSSSSAYSNIPLFLTSFYTHYFHFLIIHLLLGLGLCVRATLAFRTHWSRGHQGHELSFSFFFFGFCLIILFFVFFPSIDRSSSSSSSLFDAFHLRVGSVTTTTKKMWFRSS